MRIVVPTPYVHTGAAEKIAELFMERAEVSFVRDIAPELLEEHRFQELDARLCAETSWEVERALDIARSYGRSLKCVPQFQPRIDGKMCLRDIIYKREPWDATEHIELRLEMEGRE